MKITATRPDSYPDTLHDISHGEAFWHPAHEVPLFRSTHSRINPAFMSSTRPEGTALAQVRCANLCTGEDYWIAEDEAVCARALQLTEDQNP